MTVVDRREQLAEARAALRQTWPSLTADEIDNLPRSREEAADLLQRRTGATMEEVQTALSGVYGLIPERHEPIED